MVIKNKINLIWLILVLLTLAIFITGIQTQVCVGDESFHFRVAKLFQQYGRIDFEPHYKNHPDIGYQIKVCPLWYLGLAGLWKLAGTFSEVYAQIYQTLFYAGLLVITFLIARKLELSKKESAIAVLIMGTCPMMMAFSIFLYLDVPAVFFSFVAYYFLLDRKYILSGISSALMLLTKETGFFLLPIFLLWIWIQEPTRNKRFKSILIFGVSLFVLMIPDIIFRFRYLGLPYITPPQAQYRHFDLSYWYVPASIIHNPLEAAKYLGIVIPCALVYRFVYGKMNTTEKLITASSFIYCLSIILYFPRTLDIRYLMLGIGFLVFVAARHLLRNKVIATLIIALSLIQAVGTIKVVYARRQLPRAIEQGFVWMKQNLSPNSVILYPEESIMNYTNLAMVWVRIPDITQLFWGKDEVNVLSALKRGHVDYIVIPEHRIYDDQHVRHLGGYPRSFVNRIREEQFSILKKIYKNEGLEIWEVHGQP